MGFAKLRRANLHATSFCTSDLTAQKFTPSGRLVYLKMYVRVQPASLFGKSPIRHMQLTLLSIKENSDKQTETQSRGIPIFYCWEYKISW